MSLRQGMTDVEKVTLPPGQDRVVDWTKQVERRGRVDEWSNGSWELGTRQDCAWLNGRIRDASMIDYDAGCVKTSCSLLQDRFITSML